MKTRRRRTQNRPTSIIFQTGAAGYRFIWRQGASEIFKILDELEARLNYQFQNHWKIVERQIGSF